MTGHIRRNGSERQPIDEELSDSQVQLDILKGGGKPDRGAARPEAA